MARNLRGVLHLHVDQAGASTTERRDFTGNPVRTSRRLVREFRDVRDGAEVDAAVPTAPITTFDIAALEARWGRCSSRRPS